MKRNGGCVAPAGNPYVDDAARLKLNEDEERSLNYKMMKRDGAAAGGNTDPRHGDDDLLEEHEPTTNDKFLEMSLCYRDDARRRHLPASSPWAAASSDARSIISPLKMMMKRNGHRVVPAGNPYVYDPSHDDGRYLMDRLEGANAKYIDLSNRRAAFRNKPAVRIICLADEGRSLAVRDGGALGLAVTNKNDLGQHWIQDTRYGGPVVNGQDEPCFALVNKRTGHAIRVSGGGMGTYQVELLALYYDLGYQLGVDEESVLWTTSTEGQRQDGFVRIRPLNHQDMCLHLVDDGGSGSGSVALCKDDKTGDGCCLPFLSWRRYCKGGEASRRSLWKIVPWQ